MPPFPVPAKVTLSICGKHYDTVVLQNLKSANHYPHAT